MLDLFRAAFAPPRDLILLIAAAWLGFWLASQRARRAAADEKALESLLTWMSVAFLAGGRLLYAAAHFPAFEQSPMSLLSLNVNLFDPFSGIATAAVTAGIIIQRKRLALWRMLDLMASFLASLSIGMGLSHLASGAAFGEETRVPWRIVLWGAARYPTQIYEIIAGFLILAFIWLRMDDARAGGSFLSWVALAAASRLVIEGFRGDSTLVLGGLRLAQVLAWFILAAALAGMELVRRVEPAAAISAEG